jgi:uncharacterized protein YqgV (UPF0045/DUF77 family)
MPGHTRADLSAELKIVPSPHAEKAPRAQIEAGMQAATASGLAHESGPETTVLAGRRGEVLEALMKVLNAALDAGAHTVEVKVEAEGDAEKFGRAGGRRSSS